MIGNGHIGIDYVQFLLGRIQIQLQLLNGDVLFLQFNVRQGGIVSEQHITLFHFLTIGHQNFRDGLGSGKVNGLDPVGGDHAAALAGTVIVIAHTGNAVHKAVNIHRFLIHLGDQQRACHHSAGQCHAGQNGPDFVTLLLHGAPPLRAGSDGHPGSDRFCWRRRQWKAHG